MEPITEPWKILVSIIFDSLDWKQLWFTAIFPFGIIYKSWKPNQDGIWSIVKEAKDHFKEYAKDVTWMTIGLFGFGFLMICLYNASSKIVELRKINSNLVIPGKSPESIKIYFKNENARITFISDSKIQINMLFQIENNSDQTHFYNSYSRGFFLKLPAVWEIEGIHMGAFPGESAVFFNTESKITPKNSSLHVFTITILTTDQKSKDFYEQIKTLGNNEEIFLTMRFDQNKEVTIKRNIKLGKLILDEFRKKFPDEYLKYSTKA